MRLYIRQALAFLLSLGFLCQAAQAEAQRKEQKTLFRNGFNAAGFGNILLDHGDVDGTTLSRLSLQAGFQLARWDDVLSISLGFTKTGFYTGIVRHSEAYDGENLRYDLSGPSLHLSFFPDWRISADINYVYATARLKRNLSTAADASPARPSSIDEASWKSYEQRLKLDGSDLSLLLVWRLHEALSIVFGVGQRSLDGESKWYTDRNVLYEGQVSQDTSLSESYVTFGVRGAQF